MEVKSDDSIVGAIPDRNGYTLLYQKKAGGSECFFNSELNWNFIRCLQAIQVNLSNEVAGWDR